ncbi:hypothetical protein PtA15_3A534 [Puccinia triticina]|uniref:Uncharacterized protein n=2 Tax=Puccinia triticina TaxID=208348 RepID=A0ABY7CD69_9BASI|nr:uncharacterized protein PtA15_3A534 [Puccinia triticina]WAQ83166.1 hypothetical protein PtA15_3A534 [Puccinia triticina]
MALKIHSGRGIQLLSLLVAIFFLSGCEPMEALNSETRGEGAEDLFDLGRIIPAAGSSTAGAARQADHYQPSSANLLHPVGLPAGPSASHDSPLTNCHLAETATEERPAESLAHGQGMPPSDPGDFFGTGFRNILNLDDLVARLAGGTAGWNGLAAEGASQAHSGVPHGLDSHSHTIAGAGQSDAPALSEHSFPPSSDINSGADQRHHHKRKRVGPSLLIPNPLPLKHNYLLPDYQYHPAETATEERPAESLAHGQDMSSDPGDFFGTGFRDIWNLDDLVERLVGGTPGWNGLAAAGASQAHSGVPHVLESHTHTIAGAGQSYVPAVSDHSFLPSSDITSAADERAPHKRQRVEPSLQPSLLTPSPLSVKPQHDRIRSHVLNPFPLVRNSVIQRPQLSEPLPPTGRLVIDWTLFAPVDPTDLIQQNEIHKLLGELAKKTLNLRLVIPQKEFIHTHSMYLLGRNGSGKDLRKIRKKKIFKQKG